MRRRSPVPRLGQRELRRLRRSAFPTLVETLEDRCLLAPFPVTTTADNGDNGSPTPGSLRAAILSANASPGADDITFQLTGPAPFTISPPATLPAITGPANIDATTQSGFSGTPIVALDGVNAGFGADGFQLTTGADGSTIRGFAIHSFPGNGIAIAGAGNNLVAGNYIGTDVTGTLPLGNGNGVSISSASGNTVGGPTPAIGGPTARNLISGNRGNGVTIINSGATANLVQGNYIGTDVTGNAALGNTGSGVLLFLGASGNTIGGTTAGAGNLISGNGSQGIDLRSDSNTIQGNFIGTNAAGTAALGNSQTGIIVVGNQVSNLIGGTTSAARNLISGNAREGIFFQGTGIPSASGNNLVQGNYIGTNVTGTLPLGNGLSGVSLLGASGNTIGGTTAAAGNLISGNGTGTQREPGIALAGTGTQNNLVQNNFIGTDASGTAAIGGNRNLSNSVGIFIDTGVSNNTIGGFSSPGVTLGNTIAFNAGAGVYVFANAGFSSPDNHIIGNFIASNGADGVTVQTPEVPTVMIFSTQIASNTIVQNLGNGVSLINSRNNSVLGNAISNNAGDGVKVDTGTGNAILNNSIFANGNLAIELVNGGNNNQPAPVLTSASSAGGTTTIMGTVQGAPAASYRVQFFSSPSGGPPGFGEGQTFLGETTVTAGANGSAVINVALPVAVAADRFLTATSTSVTTLNTSQFSKTSPNLSVSKTAIPDPVFQTQNLTYTITVTNNGASPAVGVTLTDILPSGVTFVSASGGVTPVGNTLTFPIGTLNREITAIFTIVVRADTPGTITNTATVTTSDQALNPDLNPANNTATVTSTVLPVADLAVTKTADLASVPQFQNLTYTVTVTNNGPSPAVGVTLTDTLPAGAVLVSAGGGAALVPAGAAPGGRTLTFPVGTLAPGESATFTIVVQLSITGANVNTAHVTSTTADLNPENNSDEAITDVVLTFIVTTADNSGQGSLRQIIDNVNNAPEDLGPIAISFEIPGPGPFVIQLTDPLPAITHPIRIDGASSIIIDGSLIPTSTKPEQVENSPALIVLNARDSIIAGLTLRGFDGFGIKLDVSAGNTAVTGNRIIGTSDTGTVGDTPRRLGGVLVLSSHNTIGGSDAPLGNVIAGDGYGVYLSGADASGNVLLGNFIGTDRDGNILGVDAAKIDGIEIVGASDNTIGPGNVIAGFQTGIYLFGGSSRNVIKGNTIRDNRVIPPGDPNVENGGILLTDASDNIIGGSIPEEGNIIQGNRGSGVVLFNGATRNTLAFNTIRNNGGTGVYLFNAPGNRVGIVGAGNAITGNNDSGIDLEGASSSGNLVQANTVAQNGRDGVYLFNAPGNTIGGAAAGEGNDIRNNAFSGVHLEGPGATGNLVQGNTIAVTQGLTAVGPPQVFGVLLEDGPTGNTIVANNFSGNPARFIQVQNNGIPVSGGNPSGGNTIAVNSFTLTGGVTVRAKGMLRNQQLKLMARKQARAASKAKAGPGNRRHPAGPRPLFAKGGLVARPLTAANKTAQSSRFNP